MACGHLQLYSTTKDPEPSRMQPNVTSVLLLQFPLYRYMFAFYGISKAFSFHVFSALHLQYSDKSIKRASQGYQITGIFIEVIKP